MKNYSALSSSLLVVIAVCLVAVIATIISDIESCVKESTTEVVYTDTMHLASIINAECGICDDSEQYKTGSVILNRVDSSIFPDSIVNVITQINQFKGYNSPNYYPTEHCMKIAKELLNGVGRVDSILYFWNPKTVKDTHFINQMQGRILYKEKYHYYAK